MASVQINVIKKWGIFNSGIWPDVDDGVVVGGGCGGDGGIQSHDWTSQLADFISETMNG